MIGKYPYYLSNKEEDSFEQAKVGTETSGNYLITLNSKLDDNNNKINFLTAFRIESIAGESLSLSNKEYCFEFIDKGVATSKDIAKLAKYKERKLGFGPKR